MTVVVVPNATKQDGQSQVKPLFSPLSRALFFQSKLFGFNFAIPFCPLRLVQEVIGLSFVVD